MLNNILADAQTRVQPADGPRPRTEDVLHDVGVCPPHFVVFCNERKLFHFSYQHYLEAPCSVFGLEGTPVVMSPSQERGDKED